MATTLAAQLSEIRTTSSHPLDLKRRKRLHGQSLLFDSQTASGQDFETIYHFCKDGFVTLCDLDPIYAPFSETLFSAQSITQDRSQLGGFVARQVDDIIEKFLQLVGPQLPLQPALKAIEWLIRRFRVHEHNTEALLLAFLPYCDHAIFQEVLPLLSNGVPFGFLRSYVSSTICPSRQVIARALSQDRRFFKALNAFFLQSCRTRCLYPLQISFWASIMVDAIARLCDQCHSGDRNLQHRKEADLLLHIFPVLNEVLAATTTSQVQTAGSMMLIVLTSKVQLDQYVLAELVEFISSFFKSAPQAALLSMASLLRFSVEMPLPDQLVLNIQYREHIVHDLNMIQDRPGVAKLVVMIVLGLCRRFYVFDDANALFVCKAIWTSHTISGKHRREIKERLQKMSPKQPCFILSETGDEDSWRRDVRVASSSLSPTLRATSPQIRWTSAKFGVQNDRHSYDRKLHSEDREIARRRLVENAGNQSSFLSDASSQIFQGLESLFETACPSRESLRQFSELPALQKSQGMSEPCFLSFFARVWCGTRSTVVRTTSVRLVAEYLAENLSRDPQFLIPYIIYGLSDPSTQVRKAVGDLLGIIAPFYESFDKEVTSEAHRPLGIGSLQSAAEGAAITMWLSQQELRRFFEISIMPGLEECLADERRMLHHLTDQLCGRDATRGSEGNGNRLKKSTRVAIYRFLCNHVLHTPLFQVKLRLLTMLNDIERIGPEKGSRLLSPLVTHISDMPSASLLSCLRDSGVDSGDFFQAVVCTIDASNTKGVLRLLELATTHQVEGLHDIHETSLSRVRDILHRLPAASQVTVLQSLLRISFGDQDAESDARLRSCAANVLSHIRVPAAVLRDILKEYVSVLISTTADGASQPPESLSLGNEETRKADTAFSGVSRILDVVKCNSSEFDPQLLEILSAILAEAQVVSYSITAKMAFLQSLVLERMLVLVEASDRDVGPLLQHSVVKMDTIIECVRTSVSPQVRNTGLMLLSALAQRLPELTLHNIMPIFATISSKVLPQEDEYSASIVRRTLDSLLPRLVEALEKRKGSQFSALSELLFNFAAAFEHIKPQKRLNAYMLLMDRIDAETYLYLFVAILLHTHRSSRRVERFAALLVSQYGVETQLNVIGQYLHFLQELLSPKASPVIQALFLNAEKNRSFVVQRLYPFIILILADHTTNPQNGRSFDHESFNNKDVFAAYRRCVENAFALCANLGPSETQQTPFLDILNSLLRLVPTRRLVGVLHDLLSRADVMTCRQILSSLQSKLARNYDLSPPGQEIIELAQAVMTVIEDTSDMGVKLEALRCTIQIILLAGKKHSQVLLACGEICTQQLRTKKNDLPNDVECLFCLCTMIDVGKETVIPILPVILELLEGLLAQSTDANLRSDELHVAVYTMLNTISLTLPWMISSSFLKRILIRSYESANAEIGQRADKARLNALSSIAKMMDARWCLGALNETWQAAMSEGPLATNEHLVMLKSIIHRLSKDDLMVVCDLIEKIVQEVFDLRRIQLSPRTEDSYSEAEIDIVEAASIEMVMALVYKLNDKMFAPVFERLTDWAFVILPGDKPKGPQYRCITFFKFLICFFESLKGIVTHYAGRIISPTANLLEDLLIKDIDSAALWRLVVQALRCTFEHDHNDFFQTPSRFSIICTVLISQLSRAHVVDVSSEVIPAIVEFSVATDSSTQHRHINAGILDHMRSPKPAVRLGAVKCELALTERLGNEWMALLPEMLPALSELQEDDDEFVESETLRLIKKIEETVGESLDAMLQ